MSLTTPFSVQKLQTALHAKAKESPNCRFHALYDKVYRKDVLAYAYERCQANGGAAGVDNQTFENIEAYDSGLRHIRELLCRPQHAVQHPELIVEDLPVSEKQPLFLLHPSMFE